MDSGYVFLMLKQVKIFPIHSVDGSVDLSGSKSISNRVLLLASLAQGSTRITRLLLSDDTQHMLNALSSLGVSYELDQVKQTCTIQGVSGRFSSPLEPLFLGNAGTAMRPLTAILSCIEGDFELVGEPRMEERPISDLVEALTSLGAQITYLKQEGYPPLRIQGRALSGREVHISGALSSQYISALLMMAPLMPDGLVVHITGELVSRPYVEMTIALMRRFGVQVDQVHPYKFEIPAGQSYRAVDTFMIEGDASTASYFLAAAAICGGEVEVRGVGRKSIQGELESVRVLEQMGASISFLDESVICRRAQPLKAVHIDATHYPDTAMTLAVVALFATGTTRIEGIYNWRLKETDRLTAMRIELSKLGATVVEGEDFIEITPPKIWQYATIETYQDHRMAMCFSLASLSTQGVSILDPLCVKKTCPNYFEIWSRLTSTQLEFKCIP
tara:strand:- start:2014 stop:3348 length:1335 start_codon:yes stop_codon:yes gene_type:complete